MKANVPERIYISSIPSTLGEYVYTTVNKDFPNAVEYTRTDAFIEKACSWLENNLQGIVGGSIYMDDFREYMEGE